MSLVQAESSTGLSEREELVGLILEQYESFGAEYKTESSDYVRNRGDVVPRGEVVAGFAYRPIAFRRPSDVVLPPRAR